MWGVPRARARGMQPVADHQILGGGASALIVRNLAYRQTLNVVEKTDGTNVHVKMPLPLISLAAIVATGVVGSTAGAETMSGRYSLRDTGQLEKVRNGPDAWHPRCPIKLEDSLQKWRGRITVDLRNGLAVNGEVWRLDGTDSPLLHGTRAPRGSDEFVLRLTLTRRPAKVTGAIVLLQLDESGDTICATALRVVGSYSR